jgi:hypothetical protein
MRYVTSRPFVVGLVLLIGAIVAMPLFVMELTEQTCTTPSPTNPSWDCVHSFTVDFTLPVLTGVSGMALILLTLVRMRRGNHERR